MPKRNKGRKPDASHGDRFAIMCAFIEMLHDAGAGGEVHSELFFNKCLAKGIDTQVSNPLSAGLFRSFKANGFLELVPGKAFISPRFGKNAVRVWKVTDKPLPKTV